MHAHRLGAGHLAHDIDVVHTAIECDTKEEALEWAKKIPLGVACGEFR